MTLTFQRIFGLFLLLLSNFQEFFDIDSMFCMYSQQRLCKKYISLGKHFYPKVQGVDIWKKVDTKAMDFWSFLGLFGLFLL